MSETDSLDAAWAEAEAVLQDGRYIKRLNREWSNPDWTGYRWVWVASTDEVVIGSGEGAVQQASAFRGHGATPAAALRALAARLREVPQ